MKRTTIWLTDTEIRKLDILAKQMGLKIAELIRRFIDSGLKLEGL